MHRLIPLISALALLTPILSAPARAQVPSPAQVLSPAQTLRPAQTLSPESARALKPGDSFRECDDCPEMVVVPAGSFTMGSPESEKGRNTWEGPQHVVTFARAFAVGKFEVTVDQFAAFVRDTGYDAGARCWTFETGKDDGRADRSWRNPGYAQDGSHPAACLSRHDAKAYTDWLSRKTGTNGYRLLTEAEWEYAARARTTPGPGTRFAFGDDERDMCTHGNGLDQTAKKEIPATGTWTFVTCSDGYAHAAPVGSFSANGFGLYDMHGNVKEWTQDCYHDAVGYRGAPVDGSAWISGECHSYVLRGGSWLSYSRLLRAAFRYKSDPGDRAGDVGMRVARTLPSP